MSSWHLHNIQKTRQVYPMNSFIVHVTPERWLRDHRIASIPWLDRICIRYSSAGSPMVHVERGPGWYQFTLPSPPARHCGRPWYRSALSAR